MAIAGEAPFGKISISGPTLAAIIHRFVSSPADVDGLLFGHVSSLPPPDLHDDDDPTPVGPSPLSATVTGLFCSGSPMGFYDALGRLDLASLRRAVAAASAADHRPPGSRLLGWFSGRRRSPIRPSIREFAVSFSLSKAPILILDDRPASHHSDLSPKPLLFLLLSSCPSPNHAIHTHEYRAFVFRSTTGGTGALEPRSLDVINVGPAFREQYSSFSPEAAFPWMLCWPRGVAEVEGESGHEETESLNGLREAARQQLLLESSAEGFGLERLERLVGPGAADYTSELEDLYAKMLLKLEGLARLVEKSSVKVLEQENRNSLLRNKFAGME